MEVSYVVHAIPGQLSPVREDVAEAEMFAFLSVTLQMGHTVPGSLEDSWTKLEQVCCPFYGQTMVRSRYHILRFPHFTDSSRNGVGRTDDSIDRLWRIRGLFEILQTDLSKFYNPSEDLEVDKVIVKFKGSGIFKQYIPKKTHTYRQNDAAMSRVFSEGREAKCEIKVCQT
jgi:hypothetical protein